MTGRIARGARHPWVLFLIATLALASTVWQAVSAEVHPAASQSSEQALVTQNAQTLHCITSWASKVTARSEFLQRYAIPRDAAQARLDAARDENADSAVIAPLLKAFLDAQLKYNSAVKDNPIPPPPTFECATAIERLHTPASPRSSSPSQSSTRFPASMTRPVTSPTASSMTSSVATTARAPNHAPATRHPTAHPTPSPTRSRRLPTPRPTPSPTPDPIRSLVCAVLPALCPKGTS